MAEGERLVQRWTASGTHKGDFIGVPPSGKQVTFHGFSIYQLADGKIAKDWTPPTC